MANNAGAYLQTDRITWLQTQATYPAAPANTYVALWTTAPAADGSVGVEVTGGGYARVAIPSSGWSSISGASPSQISNASTVTFPTATANWGTVAAITLMDASTAGNLLELLPLFPTRTVYNGDTLTFSAGNIIVQEDSVSTYLQQARLNWYKGTTYPTAPANTYFALFTTLPALDGTGGTEVSNGSYARVAVASSTASWANPTGGGATGTPTSIVTVAAITFPTATANWGTIVGAGLYDALTGGNLLYLGNLITSRTVLNGDTMQFNIGSLGVTED